MVQLVYIFGQLLLITSAYGAVGNRFERQTSTGCPIDFVKHGSSCYRIFATPTLKWWDAMAYCGIYADGEGSLASIESESEQLFLEKELKTKYRAISGGRCTTVYMRALEKCPAWHSIFRKRRRKKPNPVQKDFWLGANDITHEGTWVWIKKDEYVQMYTNWAPGEPNSGTGENCLALFDMEQYKWNDAPCDLPEGFICEVPVRNGNAIIG